MEQRLAHSSNNYQEQIAYLQVELAKMQPKLISAEAELADRLSQISQFEFRLRARLGKLHGRLQRIEDEIETYRRQLKLLQDSWLFGDPDDIYGEQGDPRTRWDFAQAASAAASGDYRYRQAPADQPRQTLTEDESAEIKRLYRRLARRFHPDFALDEEDRNRRTQTMMAINAAYALGDVAELRAIAEQPDYHPDITFSDADLANALLREWEQCRRRLAEVRAELVQLAEHPSTILMQRTEQAAAEGVDYFDELEGDMMEQIQHKMVQRDVLKGEIEAFAEGVPEFNSDDFADAVFDLGLEMLEVDEEVDAQAFRDRNRNRFDFGETPDEEDDWRSIRRSTNDKRKGSL